VYKGYTNKILSEDDEQTQNTPWYGAPTDWNRYRDIGVGWWDEGAGVFFD
jgi:hypothetical protein